MEMSGKRVLITGAGCLGSVTARRFVDGGADVTVVDISQESLTGLGPEVSAIHADITDGAAMKEIIAGCDILVHTAAILDGDTDLMHRVNEKGTEVVVGAAAEAGAGRLVHVSSNAVYGIAHRTDITEDMGPSPSRQAYSASKAEGEATAQRIARDSDLPLVVIRPAGIFGPGANYFSASFFKRGKRRPVVFVGKGGGAMYCSYVDDVADLIATAAVHSDAEGEVFNCVIDPPPTQREYMAAWSRLSGHESYLGIPMPLAKLGGWMVKPFARKGSYLRELNANLDYIDRYVRIDASKAKRLLGWAPRYSLEEGVAATVPWLREIGLAE